MNTLEMNNYLVDENDKLTKKLAKQKRKIAMMEALNKELFQILQETQKDVESKEYTLKILLGMNDE